ncbi:MAG: hypothetical protein CMO55_10935 [Verrucomicrobiales bacterium]|nr:hypothetical protein [Verrucomicrobiales bacterium]
MRNFSFVLITVVSIFSATLFLTGCSDPQKVAKKALEEKGYEIDVRDLLVAASAGDVESLDKFVEAGVSIDSTDKAGNTALIKAASSGQLDAVEKILGMGADPRHANNLGRDALISASAKGFDRVARMLVSRGADATIRDSEGWTALSVAAYNGHSEVVSLLSASAAAPELDDALLVASFSGDSEVINSLLAQGANINARSPENKTPLMISAENGKLDAVRVLLQNQANPYAVDSSQKTAANLADSAGYPEVTSLIVNPESWGRSPEGDKVAEEMADAREALLAEGVEETLPAPEKTGQIESESKPEKVNGEKETPASLAVNTKKDTVSGNVKVEVPATRKEASNPQRQGIAKAHSVRKQSKEKPIVALNGSTIHSKAPKQAPVKSMVLAAYHEEPLPIVVSDVTPDKAEVRRLSQGTEETVSVQKGEVIPGTPYRVQEMSQKFVSSKEGKGRMVDVSRVKVENTASGTTHLLVKDVTGQASDTYAIITSADSQYRYVVKAGDVFRTTEPGIGEKDYQVLDIRASGVVIKDLATEEVVTVARDGVIEP